LSGFSRLTGRCRQPGR